MLKTWLQHLLVTGISLLLAGFTFLILKNNEFNSGTELLTIDLPKPLYNMGDNTMPCNLLNEGKEFHDANQDQPMINISILKIPRIVHFIFGMEPKFGNKPFGMVQYAAIKSAHDLLNPTTIYVHKIYEPSGFLWDQAKKMVTLNKIEPVKDIYGSPVEHVAHMADLIRLQVLERFGGIYHDMDVITLRPYKSEWFERDFVMGQQSDRSQLCNAVMMSAPKSQFITLWLNVYKAYFDKNEWDFHSVKLPAKIARSHPDLILTLDPKTFFYPLWVRPDIELIHRSSDWNWSDHVDQYAYHVWEHASFDLWKDLTIGDVFRPINDSSFKILMRRFINASWADVNLSTTL